ncbi:MAG: VanZ family protein [Roseburia sp.]|nr:VanZ family protein [Roseburia sp.]MCM1278940.1 VanZ family protein [Robinsoniella sp.]
MYNKIMQYLNMGFWYVLRAIPLGLALNILINLIKRNQSTKKMFLLNTFFYTYCIAILNITGILGMTFNFSYFKHAFENLQLPFTNPSLLMLLLNVGLFIPFGFLLSLLVPKCRKIHMILIISLLFTIVIEFLQAFSGRMTELDDVIMNTIGGIVGYIIWKCYDKYLKNRKYEKV